MHCPTSLLSVFVLNITYNTDRDDTATIQATSVYIFNIQAVPKQNKCITNFPTTPEQAWASLCKIKEKKLPKLKISCANPRKL
jgi:hypothetical protein